MTASKKTITLNGIPVCPGLIYGEARVVYSWEQTIEERDIDKTDIENELARFDKAVEDSLTEIRKWRDSAGRSIGGPVARIFESQIMIASDETFLKTIKSKIEQTGKNAEYIYSMEVEKTISPLRLSKDPYMRQMAADIEGVSNRIIRRLTGQSVRHIGQAAEDYIYVGKLFTPAEVMSLHERKVRAIVTTTGGANSHMALIARSLLIPTVVGVPQADIKIKTGDRLIVDGDKGTVVVRPSQQAWNDVRKKKAKFTAKQVLKLDDLPYFPPKTADNVEVELAANINLAGPIDEVLAEHRVGIGLYRTEFIYLQNGKFPPEDKQFQIYDAVAQRYYPRDVTIRTFDLGSDKYYRNDNAAKENNPALGWRGIRAAFDMPTVFKSQLRAILRASTRKNVKILLPMIADIAELNKALRTVRRAAAELKKEKTAFDQDIKVGIMIEVPSAAVLAHALVKKVSFISIGSNDLAQYTLAADRDNQKLAKIFNPLHPAVLHLIKTAIDAAYDSNIPVTVCGEMSGDILTIPLLIGMGVKQLSMNPSKLFGACRLIARINYSDTIDIAKKVMQLGTVKEVESFLLNYNMTLK
jgi:phosphoenolpyruvate-protein phosphotransferase (PTS system enzyme I)